MTRTNNPATFCVKYCKVFLPVQERRYTLQCYSSKPDLQSQNEILYLYKYKYKRFFRVCIIPKLTVAL